jgi:hypothetical protein
MFTDFLRDHRSGVTHDDLSEALAELVQAVVRERKVGKLVFTITVKPFGKDDGLEVAAAIKLDPPKETPGTSIFYPTPEGDLSRRNPNQQELELREIGPAEAHKALA